MLILQKKGNIKDRVIDNKVIDRVGLEWYESNKRILHKTTKSGVELILKFLKENQQLSEGDILFEDDASLIVVEILPCHAIIIRPRSPLEIAAVCYEVGNKHLPLFYQNEELLTAFERPLFSILTITGYAVEEGQRKLLDPLKTTVAPHVNLSETVFSKINNHSASDI